LIDMSTGTYEAGLEIRRATLGRDYVDRSLENATEFTQPMQTLVTEYCWGEVWSRPGLDRRSRSLLNLGMLTALGRLHELGLHVRGALNNGLSVTEIQEALLQTAIYCGVPAAIEAFRVAQNVLAEAEAAG
jgi:4-carboxymuconolactone decarboxylase